MCIGIQKYQSSNVLQVHLDKNEKKVKKQAITAGLAVSAGSTAVIGFKSIKDTFNNIPFKEASLSEKLEKKAIDFISKFIKKFKKII